MPLNSDVFHSHDFSKLPQRDIYRWLIGAVVPRPIAFVSTVDEKGVTNLAPFSFFNAVCSNPPTLLFSITPKSDGQKKDTLLNIEKTKEFVVNSSQENFAEKINDASENFPYGVSEFQKVGLTESKSLWVKPPRVLESSIQFECNLDRFVEVGSGVGSSTLVLGRILGIHVNDSVLADGNISYEKLRSVARLGGNKWLRGGEVFSF
jgi:flavin reductase (DIM6/NTAB) family NADH-FMN oxidoreductase RutF